MNVLGTVRGQGAIGLGVVLLTGVFPKCVVKVDSGAILVAKYGKQEIEVRLVESDPSNIIDRDAKSGLQEGGCRNLHSGICKYQSEYVRDPVHGRV